MRQKLRQRLRGPAERTPEERHPVSGEAISWLPNLAPVPVGPAGVPARQFAGCGHGWLRIFLIREARLETRWLSRGSVAGLARRGRVPAGRWGAVLAWRIAALAGFRPRGRG